MERQKLDALKLQRDNAIRTQLAQYQTEYSALVAKQNAFAVANAALENNTTGTMQRISHTIAGELNKALQAVINTPLAFTFSKVMGTMLNSLQAALISQNIVSQGGFSGNRYNQPELNRGGPIIIPPSFGGGRADGGDLMADRWYMTGEKGPEPLFMGSRGGYIATMKDVANYQKPQKALAGGGVNINVDMSNMQISGIQGAENMVSQMEERVVKGVIRALKRS